MCNCHDCLDDRRHHSAWASRRCDQCYNRARRCSSCWKRFERLLNHLGCRRRPHYWTEAAGRCRRRGDLVGARACLLRAREARTAIYPEALRGPQSADGVLRVASLLEKYAVPKESP